MSKIDHKKQLTSLYKRGTDWENRVHIFRVAFLDGIREDSIFEKLGELVDYAEYMYHHNCVEEFLTGGRGKFEFTMYRCRHLEGCYDNRMKSYGAVEVDESSYQKIMDLSVKDLYLSVRNGEWDHERGWIKIR